MNACQVCLGTGVDPLTPRRGTRRDAPERTVLTLVRACHACEGHGVTPLDRDYTRVATCS